MANCQVRYRDLDGIEHHLFVESDSPFEAVATAVNLFRTSRWDGHVPDPGQQFTVKMRPAPRVSYSVTLAQVEEFANHGAVKDPKDIARKQKLRDLLGIQETNGSGGPAVHR